VSPTHSFNRTLLGMDTHDRILERASEMAATCGLDGVTIGRLAEALEMSKSGVFAHFASKEALQIEVVDRMWSKLQDLSGYETFPGEGLMSLCAMVTRWLSIVGDSDGALLATSIRELDSLEEQVRDRILTHSKEWSRLLEDEIRAGIAKGHFKRRVHPIEFVFEIHALVHQGALGLNLYDRGIAREWAAHHLRKAFLRVSTPSGRKLLARLSRDFWCWWL